MRTIVVVAAALVTLNLLVRGDRSHWVLLCIGLATIALGHRGVYVGYWTYLVPLQVIVWLLWAMSVAQAVIRHKLDVQIPPLLTLVTSWAVLGAVLAGFAGVHWDAILAYTSPLVLGFPTFWVVDRLVRHKAQLKQALRILLLVSGAMSVLGIVEYFVPPVTRLVPWFFTSSRVLAQEGFSRAAFSFWGYPAAAAIVAWGVLIAYDEILNGWQWSAALILVLGAVAVYIAGQRASWLGLGLGLTILTLRASPSRAKKWLFGGIFAVAIWLLPETFQRRSATVTDFIRYGATTDTSILQHLERWQWGLKSMLSNPLTGVGYGQWLTHNVFLEIGSKIGLIPAVLFAIFIIQLITRIVKTAHAGSKPEACRYGWLFTALAAVWIVQFSVETAFSTPPFAAAYWVAMALGWYLPTIYSTEAETQTENEPQRWTSRPSRLRDSGILSNMRN